MSRPSEFLANDEAPAREPSELGAFPLRGRALLDIFVSFLTLVAAGSGLGWLLLGPLAPTLVAEFDREVTIWFSENRSATWDTLSDIGSSFSDTIVIVVALTFLAFLFARAWRRWREPLTLALALGLESSVFLAVSFLVGRERPPVEQMDPSPPTASFPSGHVGAAFAFYIGLAVIVLWNTQRILPRALAVAAAMLIPATVALGRMYRGMHYPSDVLVGAVLGAACVVLATIIVSRSIARVSAEGEQ